MIQSSNTSLVDLGNHSPLPHNVWPLIFQHIEYNNTKSLLSLLRTCKALYCYGIPRLEQRQYIGTHLDPPLETSSPFPSPSLPRKSSPSLLLHNIIVTNCCAQTHMERERWSMNWNTLASGSTTTMTATATCIVLAASKFLPSHPSHLSPFIFFILINSYLFHFSFSYSSSFPLSSFTVHTSGNAAIKRERRPSVPLITKGGRYVPKKQKKQKKQKNKKYKQKQL